MYVPSIVGIETDQDSNIYEIQYVHNDGHYQGVGVTCAEWIGHPDELRSHLRRGPLNRLDPPPSSSQNNMSTTERINPDTLEDVLSSGYPDVASAFRAMSPTVGSDPHPPRRVALTDLTEPRSRAMAGLGHAEFVYLFNHDASECLATQAWVETILERHRLHFLYSATERLSYARMCMQIVNDMAMPPFVRLVAWHSSIVQWYAAVETTLGKDAGQRLGCYMHWKTERNAIVHELDDVDVRRVDGLLFQATDVIKRTRTDKRRPETGSLLYNKLIEDDQEAIQRMISCIGCAQAAVRMIFIDLDGDRRWNGCCVTLSMDDKILLAQAGEPSWDCIDLDGSVERR